MADLWSASVTILIWDRLRADNQQRLLALPPHELTLRCIAIHTRLTEKGNSQLSAADHRSGSTSGHGLRHRRGQDSDRLGAS
ncbi:hypothetical protein [Micromonospora sp. NPDC005172]|uniref:hypothetical protein n=1 Tax=Micromonospora sp. NPDC005172 TaxID=3156867 RepID=UPI0033AC5477